MRDWIIFSVAALAWAVLTAFLGYWLLTRFPTARQVVLSPRFTAWIIVAIPLFLGALDIALAVFGGNELTFSMVLLRTRTVSPLSALSTVYTFGVLFGHLYFPTFTEAGPALAYVVARAFVGLSPTFYALTIIGFGNGAAAAHTRAIEQGGELVFASYLLAALVSGGLVGRFVLCQHVAPVGV